MNLLISITLTQHRWRALFSGHQSDVSLPLCAFAGLHIRLVASTVKFVTRRSLSSGKPVSVSWTVSNICCSFWRAAPSL
jgi:hypothetical protein